MQVVGETSGILGDGMLHQLAIDLLPLQGAGSKSQIAVVGMQQRVGQALCVACMAGPAVLVRGGDHARADRVEFDIVVAPQQVLVIGEEKQGSE